MNTKPGRDAEHKHSNADTKRHADDASHHAPPHVLQKQNKDFPGSGGKQPKPMLTKSRSFRHQGR